MAINIFKRNVFVNFQAVIQFLCCFTFDQDKVPPNRIALGNLPPLILFILEMRICINPIGGGDPSKGGINQPKERPNRKVQAKLE